MFRRTVGTWIGKNVQEPIITPIALTATVATTRAVRTIIGIKTEQPQAGAVAGYLSAVSGFCLCISRRLPLKTDRRVLAPLAPGNSASVSCQV